MEKRTIFALSAFLVIGLGAFFVMRAPDKGDRVGPRPRAFPEIKADDVTELDVASTKQEKTTLVKKDGVWRIEGPGDWAADAAAVKGLLDGLATISFGDVATDDPKKQAEMEVSEANGAHLVAKGAGGKVLADFYVGKPVGVFTMLRAAGKNEIWQETKLFQYMVNRDQKGWRDHTIFELTWTDADRLTVEAGPEKLVLEKEPGAKDAKWKVASAVGTPLTTAELDQAQVNGAVQSLASLRAFDFADDKKPEETGLAQPWLKLTVHAKDKDRTLLVGASKDDEIYVRSEGPTLFAVKKYALDRLAHKPIDYRDKTITKRKADELAAIDITVGVEHLALENAAGTWKAKGKTPVDQAKVTPIPGSFENLSGTGFAEDKTLGKLLGEVVLHGKDKKTTTLKIGAPNKDGDYRVQKEGAPDVFLVKKYSVDRFFKKPADLAPAGPPTPPKP